MQWLHWLEQQLGFPVGGRLTVELFLVIVATAAVNFVIGLVLRGFEASARKTENVWDDALVEAIRPPLYWLIWVLGVSLASALLIREVSAPAAIFQYLAPLRYVVVITLAAWTLLRLVARVESNLLARRRRKGEPLDETTADAIGKLVRASIVVTAVLLSMQALGFSISGLLAFGGVGGIAVGFAARDLLANLFGGMTIYLDRPFGVGDWIRSPDRDIEGTVERVGWRQTRIRTFDQRPLYVPNAAFNSIAVENPSRMLNRRIYETVGIRYADANRLADIVDAIEGMLHDHEAIDTARTLIVNFTRFGPSALELFVYAFTRTTEWAEYHAIKQDVLLKVLDIIGEHGAEVAFPTTTVHVADPLRLEHVGDERIS
ncbi:MAG TPA: mechanosensitive ion channel family protein [Gammaproteobacteria bacterium]|nr:mechanosensitive ion channel family protein [Gammaproteobacteria bacterium]